MREKLESLFNWFCLNIDEIKKGHEGDYVLLKDNAVQGYYETEDQADFAASERNIPDGEYLIQQCVPLEAKVVNYNWMVQYA